MWMILGILGCGPGSTWLDGTWAVTEWSVAVDGPAGPILEATLLDAGYITFHGTGEWWESDLYYEAPDVVDLGDGMFQVIDQSAWTYWALQNGEIWIAWTQDYSKPEVLVPDVPRTSVFRATSTREVPAIDGIILVTTDYTLAREAP